MPLFGGKKLEKEVVDSLQSIDSGAAVLVPEVQPARNRHINISKFFESCNFFCYIASFRRDKPICSLNQVCICRRFIVTTHFILKHNLPVNIKFA